MTTLHKAAQQALEALSEVDNCTYINDYGDAALDTAYESGMVYKAIAALRAALAEPVQKPVATLIAQRDALLEALRMFVSCAIPVSTKIDERGYRWTQAYLDQALPIASAAIKAVKGEKDHGQA